MRILTLAAGMALVFANGAQAAQPAALPGTLHFDSGSSAVKPAPAKRRHMARRSSARSNLNNQAARDGSGKQ